MTASTRLSRMEDQINDQNETANNLNSSMPRLVDHSSLMRMSLNDSASGILDNDDLDPSNLQAKAALDTRKNLARTETKAVSCLRYVVLLILLATAVGASVGTFFYSRGVEKDSFEAEFQSVAVVILRSFVESVEHKLGAQDSIASAITSHAEDAQEVFPNVTMPNYDVLGAALRTQTDSVHGFYLPLVTDDTRAGYEEYTKMMQGHVFEGYMREEGLRQYQDAVFGIEKSETQATEAATEEASAAEEENLDKIENGARRLHVAGPDVHPVIHDGIWGLTVRSRLLFLTDLSLVKSVAFDTKTNSPFSFY